MRTRNIPVQVWLNEEEFRKLDSLSHRSGLSFSSVLRNFIMGENIKERVHPDYRSLLRSVDRIGININQIAHKANMSENINTDDLHTTISLLKEIRKEIDRWKN